MDEELKAGRVYRLPTEEEWEYACRAGSKTVYSFGNSIESLGDYGWFGYNSGNLLHPVGEKKPNPWGFYDMYGSVFEWCSDRYDPNPNSPTGNLDNSARSIRGGDYNTKALELFSSGGRYSGSQRYGSDGQGFRVAMNPSGGPK